jgi:hypothetical protein
MSTKYIKKIEGSGYVSTAVEPVYGKGHSRTSAVNPDVYVDGVWMDSINGSDKVVNGTFDTDVSGWSASSSTLSVVNEELLVTNTATYGDAYQALTLTVGTEIVSMPEWDTDTSQMINDLRVDGATSQTTITETGQIGVTAGYTTAGITLAKTPDSVELYMDSNLVIKQLS